MSLVVALLLSAWPVPRDAGVEAFADPANWPNEPGWTAAWPLHSFSDGGVHVDRAWTITRGAADVTLAIAAAALDVSDPLVAHAWRLNAGELPNAVDVNGNGRIDIADLGAVADSNHNGAVDLEDVLAAFADGVDQDGNGRIDDVCGWDFVANRRVQSSDAGGADWRALAAPLDDGLPGIGVCPECTLVPFIVNDRALGALVEALDDAGVHAVLLPVSENDVSSQLDVALKNTHAVVLTRTAATVFPLALHASTHSVKSCAGPASAASVSLPSLDCDAAPLMLGAMGLLLSVAPDASSQQLVGLLGGARPDVAAALEFAEQTLPPALAARERMQPLTTSPVSAAEQCRVDDVLVPCSGGTTLAATLDPARVFVRFEERAGPYTWTTSFAAPPVGTTVRQITPAFFGPGSGPPRFVALDDSGADVVFATSIEGLRGLAAESTLFTAPLPSGRFAPAFGDVNDDGFADLVVVGDDGTVAAFDLRNRPVNGFPKQLAAAPAGPPVLAPTFIGTALITVDVDGQLTHSVREASWTHQLPAPQRSSPAAGYIDADDWADLASANGEVLHVLINGAAGPASASWSKPSRATQALLANLIDDARLEIIVDAVYDASGTKLLELGSWQPSVVPPALARLGTGSSRSLIQVEAVDGAWELTRYDVELALRNGDSLAERQRLRTLRNRPSRGGFVVADMTADGAPDVILPTEDGLLFIIDGRGEMPPESPLPTLGNVLSAPALGVARNRIELAVRTTRGDVVRWLAPGQVENLVWESAGHDRQNSNNAQRPLPPRSVAGLGITEPPLLPPVQPCSCQSIPGLAALALLFLLRRASRARR